MTHTVQPNSVSMLSETNKNLTVNKDGTEDNIRDLLSIYDSLINLSKSLTKMDNVQNKLCEKLNRLESIVQNI